MLSVSSVVDPAAILPGSVWNCQDVQRPPSNSTKKAAFVRNNRDVLGNPTVSSASIASALRMMLGSVMAQGCSGFRMVTHSSSDRAVSEELFLNSYEQLFTAVQEQPFRNSSFWRAVGGY